MAMPTHTYHYNADKIYFLVGHKSYILLMNTYHCLYQIIIMVRVYAHNLLCEIID